MYLTKFIKRIAAGAVSAAVIAAQAAVCFADGEEVPLPYADTLLPSGLTVAEFSEKMEEIATENHPEKNSYKYASAEVGIFRGGDTVFTGYYGMTDCESRIPADENSVYEWGSISKTFIWVSAMQLWEQGKLDLDRDVRDYLPDGFFQHLTYDDPITMQNLMDHNAGWQETVRDIMIDGESARLPLKEGCQSVEPAQVHRPGEVVAYSNYGAAVAAYVIECVSGTDFAGYVRENIFAPLGMEHTSVDRSAERDPWVMEQRQKNHCCGISALTGGLIDYGLKLEYIPIYPAGSAIGTLDDMLTYGKALTDDDAPLFRDKATQEKLFSGSVFYGNSDIPMWSNGFECLEYGTRVYGHSGGTNFGQANLLFDRESKTGLAIFVNEKNGNRFLSEAPAECFGVLSPDKYGTAGAETFEPAERDYVVSRSLHRGMLKFLSYISAPTLRGSAGKIGDGVYQLVDEYGGKKAATIIGVKDAPGGEISIQQPSIEAISDRGFAAKLCLLTAYFMTGAAALYMLKIRRKLKKSGRLKSYAGSAAMTAAHWARVCSGALLLAGFVIYYSFGGISFGISAAAGAAQMVCLGLCGVGAVWAVISMWAKKERVKKWRYILHAAADVLCAAGIVFFEMYRFSGI